MTDKTVLITIVGGSIPGSAVHTNTSTAGNLSPYLLHFMRWSEWQNEEHGINHVTQWRVFWSVKLDPTIHDATSVNQLIGKIAAFHFRVRKKQYFLRIWSVSYYCIDTLTHVYVVFCVVFFTIVAHIWWPGKSIIVAWLCICFWVALIVCSRSLEETKLGSIWWWQTQLRMVMS